MAWRASVTEMKVCVYGCGAIGGLLAARLATSGVDVSIIARGAQLAAIKADGLRLISVGGSAPLQVPFARASATPAELGRQDFVFLTMKAHALAAVADDIGPLLGPDTAVISAGNGIPWWYFYGLENDFGAPELRSVDAGRRLWQAIRPERALGCIVYPAAVIDQPGIVQHIFGDRFSVGEPDGSISPRLETLAGMLGNAGFDARMQVNIRTELWTKLTANAAFNPVSVITGRTLGGMIDDPATRVLLERIMYEVIAIAAAFGTAVALTPQALLSATRQLGEHKTSMLQDLQGGRPLELAPIAGAVLELADLAGVAAPNLALVFRLAASKSSVNPVDTV